MMKITEKEFNALTGETTITERDETAQEQTAREAAEAEFTARQAEAAAKETARQALLTKLGITAEEAQLLLGGN
jgi:hypothetical protein